ncbi:hypothetical protein M8J75_003321 [Diaphorina citri]|nr:hypothetical protein M8J75_003321 [Diaphorina citri]KAI5743485.1 hypothetical protein M8J77_018727 [Diaphorina citri]
MSPLTAILSRKLFKWTHEDVIHLLKAKEAFKHLEPLHSPQDDLPLILQTDASSVGMAAMLYQEKDEKRFVVANMLDKIKGIKHYN